MKYIINGRIPSKKNETRRGKYGNFYNAKQTELDAIIYILKEQKIKMWETSFEAPVKVSYKINTHSRRQDLSNQIATIDDCLEKAGIIKNDRLIQEAYSRIYFDKNVEEYAQIEIKLLDK